MPPVAAPLMPAPQMQQGGQDPSNDPLVAQMLANRPQTQLPSTFGGIPLSSMLALKQMMNAPSQSTQTPLSGNAVGATTPNAVPQAAADLNQGATPWGGGASAVQATPLGVAAPSQPSGLAVPSWIQNLFSGSSAPGG